MGNDTKTGLRVTGEMSESGADKVGKLVGIAILIAAILFGAAAVISAVAQFY